MNQHLQTRLALKIQKSVILSASIFGALHFFAAPAAAPAWPSASPWAKGRAGASEVRLIVGSGPLIEGKVQPLGLEFRLAKDWHVYWKNPGIVGFPPRLTWRLPESWSAEEIQFPAPERIVPKAGGVAYGYSHSVIYPFNLRIGRIQQGLYTIQATVDYLVCDIQCIPETAELSLTFPTSFEKSVLKSSQAGRLQAALTQLPKPFDAKDYDAEWLEANKVKISLKRSDIEDLFVFSKIQNLKEISIQKIAPQTFEVTSPQALGAFEWTATWKAGSGLTGGYATLSAPNSSASTVSGAACDINQSDSLHGGCTSEELPNFWWALLFAFLGGAILNLMPCVLPVVLLKTMSLLKLSSAKPQVVRRSLLATIFGILASFIVLAGIIFILQSIGRQVGWGFHFQSPGFVVFLVFVMFIFSLNLFGFFEVNLSSQSTTRVSRWQKGPFLEGVFATLLATPCSAPFLGTSLTYALTQSPIVLFLVFTFMGIGLSSPYLLMLIHPKTLRLLPKPGPWMNKMKFLMGLSLLVSVVWLIYVMNQQTRSEFLFWVVSGLILVAGLSFRSRSGLRWAMVALIVVSSTISAASFKRGAQVSETGEIGFSEVALQQRLNNGERLLVVVTADWCLTCKYNEKFIIQTDWFKKLLQDYEVKEVIYDWTNRDEAIGAFLRKHGRVGIPFAMLASKDKEVLMSELMTEANVRSAFEKFGR